MNVALDTTATYTSRAGAARYIRGLQRGFRELAQPGFRFRPIAWEVENREYHQPARMLKTFFRELIWAPLAAPGKIHHSGADAFHSPSNWFINPPAGMPHVITLLDLALIRFPERYRPWLRHMGRRRLRNLAKADKVITISEFTASEAMQLLDLPASKLEAIHLGNDFADVRQDWMKDRGELPEEPFFLFVGSLEPGKNLQLLRQAYENSRTELPALAIAGARWAGVPGEGKPPENWHYLGHVSDAELAWLYRHATALVFPTKYEGFGFPLLEAMGLGCPTVASKVASLPEIGGDATLWTDPNPEAYRQILEDLSKDSRLRTSTSMAGLKQAMRFSWKQCAEQTLDVYHDVV